MSNPEVARLGRRVDEQDETIRAIGDTVLDVKETVDQHTGELGAIRSTQAQHSEALGRHTELLGRHTELLGQHTEVLGQHTELLNEILRRLDAR